MNKSKHDKIKEHLESGKSITSWEAIQKYNVTRLAAIIFNLKKDGMKIEKKDYSKKNNSGQTTRFTEYKMITNTEDNEQIAMFSKEPKKFRRWLDTPPKLKKGDIR